MVLREDNGWILQEVNILGITIGVTTGRAKLRYLPYTANLKTTDDDD